MKRTWPPAYRWIQLSPSRFLPQLLTQLDGGLGVGRVDVGGDVKVGGVGGIGTWAPMAWEALPPANGGSRMSDLFFHDD